MEFNEFNLLFQADLFGKIVARGDSKNLQTFYNTAHEKSRRTMIRQTYNFLREQGLEIDDETPGTLARTYLIDMGMSNTIDPAELALRVLSKRNIGGRT